MSDDPLWSLADEETEAFCKRKLAELHNRYWEDAEPYIAILRKIEARKPPPPIIITKEQLIAAQGGKSDG